MGAIAGILFIIGQTLLATSAPHIPPENQQTQDACKPTILKSRVIKVHVRDGLRDYYANNKFGHPEFNKEDDEWVLVKENAPIPSWKVDIGNRGPRPGDTEEFSEMEHLGTATSLTEGNPDDGKDVYIGTGWCDPGTGNSYGWGADNLDKNMCQDPLVQDVLFVPIHEGVTLEEFQQMPDDAVSCDNTTKKNYLICFAWGEGRMSEPPRTEEYTSQYWWRFNVYYKASKLPANAQYEDLPCWMKLQCPGGSDIFGNARLEAIEDANCEVGDILGTSSQESTATTTDNVLAATDPLNPRLIVTKAQIENLNEGPATSQGVTLANYYISWRLTEAPNESLAPIVGQLYNYHFDVRIFFNLEPGAPSDHALILDPRLLSRNPGNPVHDGPYWMFIPLVGAYNPERHTLQLGSFIPAPPSFFYEWWTPSCKPALYLYPPAPTNVTVQVHPEGYITESIPPYGKSGWNVTAYPDGTIQQLLTDNLKLKTSTYPYLYYEASINKLAVPKNQGWVKKTDELPYFFTDVLQKLGLNTQESKDFMEYWIPKLTEGNNWYITLINESELNRVEKLTVSPKPDTMIRVRFYFENLDEKEDAHHLINLKTLKSPLLTSRKRNGFTLVDWGGIVGNGSCGIEEVSQ